MKKWQPRSTVSATEFWAPLLALAILWHGCEAHAQDLPDVSAPCAPELTANRRAVLPYEGASGIWFNLELARCMLGRLEALPLYVQRVHLLEERLHLGDERHGLMVRQVTLAEEGEQRAVNALEAAERLRRQAEEDRDAWYRHPAFWAVVGAVIVAGLEALAIWALSQTP
jgi:hypothetical protein